MGIVFEQRPEGCRPRIVCDVCEQPITRLGSGLVVYEEAAPGAEPATTRAFVTHKRPACRLRAWAMAGYADDTGDVRDDGPCLELASHLVYLLTGVGMFPEEFSEEYEFMLAKGEVPTRARQEV